MAEHPIRFGLMYGMAMVEGIGDSLSEGYLCIASLQGDEGWCKATGDVLALKNVLGVGRLMAEVVQALRGTERAK